MLAYTDWVPIMQKNLVNFADEIPHVLIVRLRH
jgi:hypothetical protein